MLGDCIQVWKERAKFVVVSLLPPNNTPYKRNFPWCSCREGKKMYQKRVLHVQIISHETYCFFDVLVAIAVIVAKASTKTIRDRASSPHNLKLFGFIDVCNGWESEYDFSTNACESRPNTLNVINPEKSPLV